MIAKNEVHIWQQNLQLDAVLVDELSKLLNKDEMERAARFVFEKDRRRFIVARAKLRQLLANYTHLNPQQINFVYNEHGKPGLKDDDIFFNVSHSDEMAMYVLSFAYPVGIDIESIKAIEALDIAQRFFSPQETVALKTFPEDKRLEAFFRCWTRKEALIKAFGQGLFFELNQCEVSLDELSAHVISIHNDVELAKQWSMHTFQYAPNYLGAVAAQGQIDHFIFKNEL